MNITHTAKEVFVNENSLISTRIDQIKLNRNTAGELEILIVISGFSRKSQFSKINLLFTDIIEFGFYFNNNYTFYTIENYKLLHIHESVYLSFDPDATESKSIHDSDFIFAGNVELI